VAQLVDNIITNVNKCLASQTRLALPASRNFFLK